MTGQGGRRCIRGEEYLLNLLRQENKFQCKRRPVAWSTLNTFFKMVVVHFCVRFSEKGLLPILQGGVCGHRR